MSRFYDALKQASQSLQVTRESPGARELNASGGTGIDIPEILGFPEAGEAPAPDALSAGEPSGVLLEEEHLSSEPIPRDGAFGTAARVALDRKARLIPHSVDPTVVEHYRLLRTKILQQRAEKKLRSLLVTSPSPQEGKTVTVLNLGLTFAMLPEFKVLVVDGDLRRGSLGEWLGVRDRPGLGNLIDGSATLEEVVLKSEQISMDFIVRGNSKMPAAELLHSAQLPTHFRKMTERFDLVLVDSPPVSLVTDAQLLAPGCDAVLLVARMFSTTCKALEEANQELLPFRVIGTVMNGGAVIHSYRRYRSYY